MPAEKLHFGLAQEDPEHVFRVLEADEHDRVLCVASAGEVPLGLLAMGVNSVTAVDISEIQLRLTGFKLAASIFLDKDDAACLIGLRKCDPQRRVMLAGRIIPELFPASVASFWKQHTELIRHGPARMGKYERYLSKFSPIARAIIGTKNLERLLACTSIAEQEQVFDENIATRKALQYLFKITFHPALYSKGGIAPEALRHHGDKNPGDYFFRNFRLFCTSTLARSNYFLQFFLLGECVTDDALPEYLQNKEIMVRAHNKLTLSHASMNSFLANTAPGAFKRIHLSNICDWMPGPEIEELFSLLFYATSPGAVISYHYIHKPPQPEWLQNRFTCLAANQLQTAFVNRYPFSELVQLKRI